VVHWVELVRLVVVMTMKTIDAFLCFMFVDFML
jgi:hypothetical protein